MPKLRSLRSLRSAPLALAYWLGLAGAAQRANDCARILMFHSTPRHQARGFERVLRYVQRQFDVVSLGSLADAIDSPTAPLKRKVVITFDDGVRNNVDVAYPILQKLRLPATFFVCPGLIDRGQWLWNHEARQRLLRLSSLSGISRDTGGPIEVEAFIEWMKKLELSARNAVEKRVREATPDFAPTEAERHEFDLAGWDELRRLDPRIVTIGSHTLSHPILTSLDAREMEVEVAQSRRLLATRLRREVDLFAYPNGGLDPAVHECVRRHYRVAVCSEEGWVGALCDRHLLPRVSASWSPLKLAKILHRPMPQPLAPGLRPIFA
jgi:peptidoglycan/xylan/chitin deacetylase (PgdA/CDA1 family)